MDTTDLERQIAETQTLIEDLRRQMGNADERFCTATGSMLGTWYKEEAERLAVYENPEHSLELGADEIGKLKEELREATERLPEGIGEEVSLQQSPAEIDFTLQEMTKGLGAILLNFGVITPGSSANEIGQGVWTYLSWPPSGPPVYEAAPTWSDEMKKAKDEYLTLQTRLSSATDELAGLRHQKAQEDAKRLWDEAAEY